MTYSRDSGGQALGLSASSTIHTPSRLEGQMEDPEEWNVPSLSLFMSLDDYPSHRPPGGRGGPVGPREQVGTTMPLLGPYHLGPEARGRGDPRLTAQRGRGSGSTGTGRPRGEPGARSTHAPALIHPGACRHTPHTRRAQCHRNTGEKGNRTLRAVAVGRFTATITKDRGPRRQCAASTPSLSASSGPEASSGPAVRPSTLPSALPWSSLLCCFCRRVSLYLRVMSLRVAGVRHHRPARGGPWTLLRRGAQGLRRQAGHPGPRRSPQEEAPDSPSEGEHGAERPALGDVKGQGQRQRVRVVLHHDQQLRDRDGSHQPGLLAQLLVQLPADRGGAAPRPREAPPQGPAPTQPQAPPPGGPYGSSMKS